MANLNEVDRMALTRGIMNLLEGWGLSARDIIKVLDLPDSVRPRHIGRFRDATPFPDEPGVMKRIDYLLRISDALRTYFPCNPEARSIWMRRGNRRFRQQAPLAYVVEGGESGLSYVLCNLDCTYAWDATGSTPSCRQ